MPITHALDDLYASGWTDADSQGCERAPDPDGRSFPCMARVAREFESAGCTLTIRPVRLFDCYRAEWRDAAGNPAGAAAGVTEPEAALHALAHLRRQLVMQF